jgi:hypothetical protein
MGCPQRWQSLCIHFTLQELFWLGKPASVSRRAERSLQIFSQSDKMPTTIRASSTKTPLRPVKIQKYFRRYIKTGNLGLYFNKHPKNLNILHRRRKRVFREKEKTVKKTLIRILVVFGLLALGSTTVLADGGNPLCRPGVPCSITR